MVTEKDRGRRLIPYNGWLMAEEITEEEDLAMKEARYGVALIHLGTLGMLGLVTAANAEPSNGLEPRALPR